MKRINHAVIVDTCTKRLLALKAHVAAKSQIPIDGQAHKVHDLIAIYQKCLDTRAVLSSKRAEVKAALVESANAEAKRRAADRALKPWVVNTFGANSEVAHDFGFPPPRAPNRTAEEKLLAVEQAKATRAARHTMGSKQKAKLKGVIVEPIAAPAAPAPRIPEPVATAPAPITNGALNGASNGALNGASNGALPHA